MLTGVICLTISGCGRGNIAALKEEALLGSANAQYKLGRAYALGKGVQKDGREAVIWYERAADPKNEKKMRAKAQYEIGQTYYYGKSVPQDCQEAMEWLIASAEKGNAKARSLLREALKARFTDTGDGTMTDTLTGLEWVKAPHQLPGNAVDMDWNSAVKFMNNLNYAGHSDWTLPKKDALEKQFPLIRYYTGVKDNFYWSRTPGELRGMDSKWVVCMKNGYMNGFATANDSNYVWPVRGGK